MGKGRSSSGLLLLAVVAVAGYLLVKLPPTVVEQYGRAVKLGPGWGYAYLAAVSLGALLLWGLVVWMLVRVLANTWR